MTIEYDATDRFALIQIKQRPEVDLRTLVA
jgi:hypothetical protein